MAGWALKSNSSSVLVDGNPAIRMRPCEPALLGCCDLDREQVAQELGVAGFGLLGLLERCGQLLCGGGELQVGQVSSKLLVGGVLVHRATLAICAYCSRSISTPCSGPVSRSASAAAAWPGGRFAFRRQGFCVVNASNTAASNSRACSEL